MEVDLYIYMTATNTYKTLGYTCSHYPLSELSFLTEVFFEFFQFVKIGSVYCRFGCGQRTL